MLIYIICIYEHHDLWYDAYGITEFKQSNNLVNGHLDPGHLDPGHSDPGHLDHGVVIYIPVN